MGECASLCHNRNQEEDDIKNNNNNKLPVSDLSNLNTSKKDTDKDEINKKNSQLSVKFNVEEKEKEENKLNFEEITDDKKNEKSDSNSDDDNLDENVSGLKYEDESENNKVEKLYNYLSDKLITNKINLLKNKLNDLEDEEEEENNNDKKDTNQKNEEIKDNNEKNEENKGDINIKNMNKEKEKKDLNDNKEKEENNKENEEKKEFNENNEKEKEDNNKDDNPLKKNISLRSQIGNIFSGKQNQKEERKEEKKEENEEDEEEEEEEDDDEEEKKTQEILKEKNTEKDNIYLESKDLEKYNLLIQIININLEAKGFSKEDIKKEIDELYKSFADPISPEDLILKLSEKLINLMEISIESDKNELKNFVTELCTANENDKNKIYNQIMKCIEGIEEQEKLKTKKLNRNIRGKIQECKDKLNQRLKEDDVLTDKIANIEKFYQIVEETGINLKEEFMNVLLYQMKMAVPKGKSFNSLNISVINDFLK